MHIGKWSVNYHFQVTLTLISDLVFRIILSRTHLLYKLRCDPKFGVWMHLGMVEGCVPFTGHCDLKLDLYLVFRIIALGIPLILYEVRIPNLV